MRFFLTFFLKSLPLFYQDIKDAFLCIHVFLYEYTLEMATDFGHSCLSNPKGKLHVMISLGHMFPQGEHIHLVLFVKHC